MQVRELAHILSLSNLLPSPSKLLVGIIDCELASSGVSCQDPHAEYEATYAKSAWVIGACIRKNLSQLLQVILVAVVLSCELPVSSVIHLAT